MGNNPASSKEHRRIKTVVTGCERVAQIKDNVSFFRNDEEHDERLRKVLAKRKNVSLVGLKLSGLVLCAQSMV